MDRVTQLRAEPGGSQDSTLDSSSPSEAYLTASENSKYFSFSEEDSFNIPPIKNISLTSGTDSTEKSLEEQNELITNLPPISKTNDLLDSYKIGKHIEAANILSGGVNIFDDNDNSYDGNELVIDDSAEVDEKNAEVKLVRKEVADEDATSVDAAIPSKDTEVVLQIDGKNVDAIDIGNGLYLYRREGVQEELAAVQIVDTDHHQPSFKFLKVRENAEGNLEVYEEIEVEVPKDVPLKDVSKDSAHVPTKEVVKPDIPPSNVLDVKAALKETTSTTISPLDADKKDETENKPETKSEVNFHGKPMKFSKARKSPLIGSFTPMTYHSTPNKEGIPLTKTMVDQHLHPSRHSDNAKKTIEVNTESCKQKIEPSSKSEVLTGTIEVEPTKLIETKDDNLEINKDVDEVDCCKVSEKEIDSEHKVSNKNLCASKTVEVEKKEEYEQNLVVPTKEKDTLIKSKLESAADEVKMTISDTTSDNLKSFVTEEKICTESKMSKEVTTSFELEKYTLFVNDNNKLSTEGGTLQIMQVKQSSSDSVKSTSNVTDITEKNIVKVKQTLPVQKVQTSTNLAETSTTKVSKTSEVKTSNSQPENKNIKPSVVTEETIFSKEENVKLERNIQQKLPPINLEDNLKIGDNLVKETSKKDNVTHATDTFSIKQTDQDHKKVFETTKLNDLIFVDKRSKADTKVCDDLTEVMQKPDAFIKISEIPTLLNPKEVVMPKSTDNTINKDVKTLPKITRYKTQLTESNIAKIPEIGKIVKLNIIKTPEMIKPVSPVKTEMNNDFINKYVHKALIIKSVPSSSTDVSKTNESASEPETSSSISAKEHYPATEKKDTVKIQVPPAESKQKPLNNNAVPFGKWTEANKQEYLIKIKETKVATNNTNQIKQTNDLNRRDVLKKIDTQRQIINLAAAKVNELANVNKQNQKSESSAFLSKSVGKQDVKPDSNAETQKIQSETNVAPKHSIVPIPQPEPINITLKPVAPLLQPDAANIIHKNTNLSAPQSNSLKDASKHSTVMKSPEPPKDMPKNTIVHLSQPDTVRDAPRHSDIPKFQQQPSKSLTVSKSQPVAVTVASKITVVPKIQSEPVKITPKHTIIPLSQPDIDITPSTTADDKTEPSRVRKAQTLIDKTIEDYLLDGRPTIKFNLDNVKRWSAIRDKSNDKATNYHQYYSSREKNASIVNDIEMKMNELHGVPFVERPSHELPHRHIEEVRCYTKSESYSKVLPMTRVNKIPPLVPLTNKHHTYKPEKIHGENISDEEIIEHEPITGDIDLTNKLNLIHHSPIDKVQLPINVPQTVTSNEITRSKNDSVITETEFDKFVRRNSITYENCITLNYELNNQQVVQTVIEKDNITNYSKSFQSEIETKSQLPNVQVNDPDDTNFVTIHADDNFNKSKLQIAYNSAMSAKLHKESTITTIEDKPVKVVFMDSRTEFLPSQLNVQGKDLSPAKRRTDFEAMSSCDSLDSDILDVSDESKSHENIKKYKHQRKQVLTPVEEPEMELILPSDIGLETSPKKRRKIEELFKISAEKNPKSILPKKTYLLGRNTNTESQNVHDTNSDQVSRPKSATVSAIDSLVKAAELLDNQAEKDDIATNVDSQRSSFTPVKRGRGRPRKYPLSEDGTPTGKTKTPTPRKKLRVEHKLTKQETSSDEDSNEERIIRENWTMGKINENIVCPICRKLFRSENVVFKHVKHCTGPSPNRSESGDNRSPKRVPRSQEIDSKSDIETDSDEEVLSLKKINIYKLEQKQAISKPSDEVIVIEDTPIKPKVTNEKREAISSKYTDARKTSYKLKAQLKPDSLVCEFCGKTFRQLSYLVSHKMQHKKDELKKVDNPTASNKSSVFSCEVCKKVFRKLHHLVQHRMIHNPPSMPPKMRRKSSVEKIESKTTSNVDLAKNTDDQGAGFRCEPCDKSFRKLHHLVEHRETHDGINRQKIATTDKQVSQNTEKQIGSAPSDHQTPPQCDVCKKTFRKLHHLIEHKEQHNEVTSEKSDDKSVRSSLSTRDIIHECPLCYMVFPNEHSLTKHSVNCQRKKRQSASKSTKLEHDDQMSQGSLESTEVESVTSEKSEQTVINKENLLEKSIADVRKSENDEKSKVVSSVTSDSRKSTESKNIGDAKQEILNAEPIGSPNIKDDEIKSVDTLSIKKDEIKMVEQKNNNQELPNTIPIKTKKTDIKENIVKKDTPKKRRLTRDKLGNATITKRQKTNPIPLPVIEENKLTSEEDEIRYMLNPDFNSDDNTDSKLFMKVRAQKRSSLQIERPNSKDLIKRRTSLQHPSKVPRAKPKVDNKTPTSTQPATKPIISKANIDPSTDSDENDVKYSFPKPIAEVEKKIQKKTMSERRKSLSLMAKRKSLGKAVTPRRKTGAPPLKNIVKPKALPVKATVKKRTTEAGHRCDCGQLFNSGALLARHTSLAHTPPRVRRRRSPLPDLLKDTKDAKKTTLTPRKSTKIADSKSAAKTPKRKENKPEAKSSVKGRNSAAHRGVPVPEKMRKMMEKLNK